MFGFQVAGAGGNDIVPVSDEKPFCARKTLRGKPTEVDKRSDLSKKYTTSNHK
jgi:hypothetical protein